MMKSRVLPISFEPKAQWSSSGDSFEFVIAISGWPSKEDFEDFMINIDLIRRAMERQSQVEPNKEQPHD